MSSGPDSNINPDIPLDVKDASQEGKRGHAKSTSPASSAVSSVTGDDLNCGSDTRKRKLSNGQERTVATHADVVIQHSTASTQNATTNVPSERYPLNVNDTGIVLPMDSNVQSATGQWPGHIGDDFFESYRESHNFVALNNNEPESSEHQFDPKEAKRRESNRKNAARSRIKQKNLVNDLQKRVRDLEKLVNDLSTSNAVLQSQIEFLQTKTVTLPVKVDMPSHLTTETTSARTRSKETDGTKAGVPPQHAVKEKKGTSKNTSAIEFQDITLNDQKIEDWNRYVNQQVKHMGPTSAPDKNMLAEENVKRSASDDTSNIVKRDMHQGASMAPFGMENREVLRTSPLNHRMTQPTQFVQNLSVPDEGDLTSQFFEPRSNNVQAEDKSETMDSNNERLQVRPLQGVPNNVTSMNQATFHDSIVGNADNLQTRASSSSTLSPYGSFKGNDTVTTPTQLHTTRQELDESLNLLFGAQIAQGTNNTTHSLSHQIPTLPHQGTSHQSLEMTDDLLVQLITYLSNQTSAPPLDVIGLLDQFRSSNLQIDPYSGHMIQRPLGTPATSSITLNQTIQNNAPTPPNIAQVIILAQALLSSMLGVQQPNDQRL